MKNIPIKTEAELAEIAEVFFTSQNWKLYPEVVIDLFGGRPDFVGVKNQSLCQAVECKLSLSYPLIEQLARWQIDAESRREWKKKHHFKGEIAVPHLLVAFTVWNSKSLTNMKKLLLNQYRIGVYGVSKYPIRRSSFDGGTNVLVAHENYWTIEHGEYEYEIRMIVAPKLQIGSRQSAHKIINSLKEDMCCTKSGLQGGKADYMTPFKRTMNRVRKVLSDGQERHIDRIIQDIKPLGGHHYRADNVAKSSICKFIDKFEIAERSRDVGPWFVITKQK
ncbi:hypothetical protein F0238_21470 [Vibrio coralliilyticus]|uniref:Uncharacterized protein n=2 Tax=Vibrio coralliilyticus TaxID=190893 RepID=A0AAP7DES7_9VIBR|nr:hypothetical protein [Vibrio coralliilyticus]NOI31855.1 hypothetical protein [Vibrio coralliilyticus]NOJ25299.1 hypothetical protein [Vibrio coralliilyticus]